MNRSTVYLCLISIGLFTILTPVAHAQSPTPVTTTPSPTNESITEALSEQISDLKEKIASRVAQMNLVEKRGIAGEVTDVSSTQISMIDIYGKTRFIDVDEITEFYAPDNEEAFGISDIEEGMKLSILGLYNKQSERILARFVDVISIPEFVNGEITSIDEDEFSIDVTKSDGTVVTFDIENSTTTQEYVDEDFVRSGFSQMEIGQKVFITGFANEEEENRYYASRILILIVEDETSENVQEE